MSTLAIPRPGAWSLSAAGPAPTWWETAFVSVTLVLASSAVVPLVFNPGFGAGGTVQGAQVTIYDPVSQPVWLLLTLFILAMLVRHGGAIAVALARNPGIVAVCYFAIASTAWSSARGSTLQYSIELAFSTLFGVYVGVRYGLVRLVRLLSQLTVVIAALSALFALALPKYGLDHAQNDVWRGVFTTKNELGRAMVLGGTVWSVRLVTKDVSRRAGLAALTLFAVVGAASGSRTALGVSALMVGALVLAALFARTGRHLVPIKGLVVSGLLLAAVVVATNVKLLLHTVGSDYSLTGRAGIWGAVADSIAVHPWFGYGFGAFWRGLQGPDLAVWRAVRSEPPHSHNGFLDLLLNLGGVGLAAFLFAYAVALRRAVARLKWGSGTARLFPFAFLCFLLLYNLTESALVDKRALEWIAFVAIAAALAVAPRPEGPVG